MIDLQQEKGIVHPMELQYTVAEKFIESRSRLLIAHTVNVGQQTVLISRYELMKWV